MTSKFSTESAEEKFFYSTVDSLYTFLLFRTRTPKLAQDITVDLYRTLSMSKWLSWKRESYTIRALFRIAEKRARSVQPWQEESQSIEQSAEYMRFASGKEDKFRVLLNIIRNMPQEQQNMSVMYFFLRWSPESIAKIIGEDQERIKQMIDYAVSYVQSQLRSNPLFSGNDEISFISGISPIVLDDNIKMNLRNRILQVIPRVSRYSPILYSVPAIAFISTIIGFAVISMYAIEPQSLKTEIRSLAAVEMLITNQEKEIFEVAKQIEEDIRGIAAFYAKEDIALIAIELASHAVSRQNSQEKEAGKILEQLDTPIISASDEYEIVIAVRK